MEFIKFERSFHGFLDFKEASDIKMELIGLFLDSDLACFSDRYLKWLTSESDGTGGNLTFITKYKDTIRIINSLTDNEVTITKDQFFQIVSQWALVYKPAPKELLIKKINDHFIFEPTYD